MAGQHAKPQAKERSDNDRVVASNRKARHEYFVIESIEAGIALTGTEIKSVREGKVTLGEAYARIENKEFWLIGANIAPYTHGNRQNHEPDRPRKLLVHRRQIAEIREAIEQKGMTTVPLRMYLKQGKAKVEIGIVKGKKLYDKRDASAERESKRDIERAIRDRG